MITLEIEEYCQECSDFTPECSRIYVEDLALDRHVSTRVTCEYANRCKQLVRYLKKQEVSR